jgi:hypothetical protein
MREYVGYYDELDPSWQEAASSSDVQEDRPACWMDLPAVDGQMCISTDPRYPPFLISKAAETRGDDVTVKAYTLLVLLWGSTGGIHVHRIFLFRCPTLRKRIAYVRVEVISRDGRICVKMKTKEFLNSNARAFLWRNGTERNATRAKGIILQGWLTKYTSLACRCLAWICWKNCVESKNGSKDGQSLSLVWDSLKTMYDIQKLKYIWSDCLDD